MAIAIDATSSGFQLNTTSVTVSHVVSGSDRVLLVFVANGNNYPTATTILASGVTYNSVAMTSMSSSGASNVIHGQWFYLIAPDTGTHDIVVTMPSSQDVVVAAISLTGVKQTGFPDAGPVQNIGYAGYGTWTSSSITTTVDNAMVLAGVGADSWAFGSPTPFTQRVAIDDGVVYFNKIATYEKASAGSQTVDWFSGYNSIDHSLISVAPAVAAATGGSMFLVGR